MSKNVRRFAFGVTFLSGIVGFACGGHVPAPVPPAPAAAPVSAEPAPATAVDEAVPACGDDVLPATRVWRLTHTQLRNTLRALFGFVGPAADALPADARLHGYANGADGLGVSPLLLDYYRKVADEVSTEAVRRHATLLPCPLAELAQASCRGDFVRRFGARAFRRPLSGEEQTRLDRVYADAARAGGPDLGLKMIVEAIVLAPAFLFRFELGDDSRPGAVSQLSDFEIASALSYTLWDGPPDAALYALAERGQLRDPGVRAGEAARLLGDRERASAALVSFFQQWLKIDHLPTLGKDPSKFPQYDARLAKDLLDENRHTVTAALYDGDRSLRTLLAGTHSFLNNKTGKLYDLPVRGSDFKRTALDPRQRRGLLTQPAFLAARADGETTKPVDRGAFVREEILCAEVPPPPDEFTFDADKITPDMTAREKLAAHAKSAFCARCHALFDGIGFALERYDAIGQFRLTDKSKIIDPSGTVPMPNGDRVPFADFVDLVDKLARRPEPYDCFAERALAYTTGRVPTAIPACEKKAIARAFSAAGHRVDRLILDIVAARGFTTRRNPVPPAPTAENAHVSP